MNKLRLTGLLLARLLGLGLVCASCVQSGYAQQSGGGNYPTGNGVRVREVDGSPNVPGTQTLVFPNGSLTRAGQTVTVTIASGTTINATNGVIPYRSSSTAFTDSNLNFSANVIEQRNSTNAQTFRVYNTYTDASNYERADVAWSSNNLFIQTSQSGTGTARNLVIGTVGAASFNIRTNASTRWTVDSNGHFVAATDNTYDIGASGATRPRNVYVAGVTTSSTGFTTDSTGYFQFSSRGYFSASADGIFLLRNAAATDFSRLQFGGTTSSFPALKRSSAALEVRLADDSAYAEHRALTFSVNNACVIRSGSGTPESAVTGNVCDLYLRTDGGANTTLYIKESGAATNTGWIAK